MTPAAGECGVKDQVSRSGPPAQRRGGYVVVGPTAAGKSDLARELAVRRPALELVSADAMAVYRGFDIGTAKPPLIERRAWHLLDLVEPGEEFSVAAFKAAAAGALEAIAQRGHRALVVGGTGLYVSALVDDLALPGRYPEVAAALEAEAERPGGVEALYARLAALDPVAAGRTTVGNRRRIVRALEVTLGSGRRFSSFGPGLSAYPPTSWRMVGLRLPRDELDRRIAARLEAQLEAGFLEEVRALRDSGVPLSRTAAQALGYRELRQHLAGETTLEEAKARILARTRVFARRQEAWFGRDPRVVFLDATAPDLPARALAALDGLA